MPVTLDFSVPIPDRAKADVERRLSVRSDPAQEGAWRWYGNREVIYRPKDFWQAGTRLTMSTTLGGLPMGEDYIDADRRAAVTIGRKTTFQISDATKQMRVFQNDKLVRTFPVSLAARPRTRPIRRRSRNEVAAVEDRRFGGPGLDVREAVRLVKAAEHRRPPRRR
jgi:hypothetical protein